MSTIFNCNYLPNRSTLDIGVLGFFGIVSHKEHPPEVWSVPPVTPCMYKKEELNSTSDKATMLVLQEHLTNMKLEKKTM
jgi:hypothetical protein